jgi:nicotinate-nucleotide pyrophosphorylase (carboxylating)
MYFKNDSVPDHTLKQSIQSGVKQALQEDLGGELNLNNDITAQLIPASHTIQAHIISRETGILAGTPWVDETFKQLDSSIEVNWKIADGETILPNAILCQLKGKARALLMGERTALNFLQTLSATATITHHCVQMLAGTATQLLDTRKTLPGMRLAQKYAVRCGGGSNHRMGLHDAFLIKENHILACGSIRQAIANARSLKPDALVEIEVESLDELKQALQAGADWIMLDNFSLADIGQAVVINKSQAKLEVSGNVTQAQLTALADTGVDFISSGALTKHINALDLSFRVISKE